MRPSLPAYAELHCLSNFSFLRGASHPDELVQRAAALGYCALAITDECSLSGVVRAHVAAKAAGLPLIIGSELRLAEGTLLVVLATDRDGYGHLCELITRARRRAHKGSYTLLREDFGNGPGEALPGCLALLIPELASPAGGAGQARESRPGGPGRLSSGRAGRAVRSALAALAGALARLGGRRARRLPDARRVVRQLTRATLA